MLRWPCGKFVETYLLIGASLGVLWLVIWNIHAVSRNGDPDPFSYLPLVNPLELSQILSMVVILFWKRAIGQFQLPASIDAAKRMLPLLTGGIGFLALNGMVARVVHFYGGVPYSLTGLYHSSVFQAAIAALWCSCALAVTVSAARRGNRLLWFVGAVLLALVVVKLFVVDLAGSGTVARIVSFLVVGGLMLVIGYFSPLPPAEKEK